MVPTDQVTTALTEPTLVTVARRDGGRMIRSITARLAITALTTSTKTRILLRAITAGVANTNTDAIRTGMRTTAGKLKCSLSRVCRVNELHLCMLFAT